MPREEAGKPPLGTLLPTLMTSARSTVTVMVPSAALTRASL